MPRPPPNHARPGHRPVPQGQVGGAGAHGFLGMLAGSRLRLTGSLGGWCVFLEPVCVFLQAVCVFLEPVCQFLQPMRLFLLSERAFLETICASLEPECASLETKSLKKGGLRAG